MERMICLAIGYVFGLFQTAYIYGRFHGIDIRQHGSGNAGTTNTLRILGKKAGAIVLAGDILKCMLAIGLTRLLYSSSHLEMFRLLSLYAAAGAILGHNFPFYLKFRGGKGIAVTAGLILSFHWMVALVGIILFFSTFFLTHYVSLGSLLVYGGFLIQLIIMGQWGMFHMSQVYLNEMYIVAFLMTAMAYYKHRENIKRLIKGTERKTYLSKKSEGEGWESI